MELTELVAAGGHEQVVGFADASVGLRGIIAVHSTALGPSLGGIRFWRYASDAEALHDVLRLSTAMTMKAAVAGLRQGGGKAVVHWDDPRRERDDAFRRALGRAVHLLGGRYVAAEDVGATQADMDGIFRETPWVTGIDPACGGSGDPSPVTAWGVLHGMHAACAEAFGERDLAGRRVVIQGVGHVGAHLARLLVDAGADVAVADIDAVRADRIAAESGCVAIAAGEALSMPCDILAPCALGGVLTVSSVAALRCAIICGAANNQLADDAADDALARRAILYVPDFVANAGGIVNIAHEWEPGGYSRDAAMDHAAGIEQTTRRVFALAAAEGLTPGRAATVLGTRRLTAEGAEHPYAPGDESVMREALLARWRPGAATGSASLPTSRRLPSP